MKILKIGAKVVSVFDITAHPNALKVNIYKPWQPDKTMLYH